MTVNGQPKHIGGERVVFHQGGFGNRWRASKPYAHLGSFWTDHELESAIKREQRRRPKPEKKKGGWW